MYGFKETRTRSFYDEETDIEERLLSIPEVLIKTFVRKKLTLGFVIFMSKIKITDHCWLWQDPKHLGDYGKLEFEGVDGRKYYISAHRIAYEHSKGTVPKSMTIDHMCWNKRCVRPSHLQVVSMKENIRRAEEIDSYKVALVIG